MKSGPGCDYRFSGALSHGVKGAEGTLNVFTDNLVEAFHPSTHCFALGAHGSATASTAARHKASTSAH